jgi:hypothetical protein
MGHRTGWLAAVCAATTALSPSCRCCAAAARIQVWNLRTWQLEMVDWPVSNGQRQDIQFDPFADRSGGYHSESIGVLPENERSQV